MRILLVTDAWAPQVNGVVVTLRNTMRCWRARVTTSKRSAPDRFRSFRARPTPRSGWLSIPAPRLAHIVRTFEPDAVHIATEGPLGMAARNLCLCEASPFTTAYHTRFPEYVHARVRLPLA